MRKLFLNNCANNEDAAVKAFTEHNKENALKTKPKGYEADNPNIKLLRLRNFTIGKKLKDEEIVGKGGVDRIVGFLQVLVPFVSCLHLAMLLEI